MKKADDIVLIADYGRSGQGWLSYMLCYILNARYIEPYDLLGGRWYTGSEDVISLTGGNIPNRESTRFSMVVKTHGFPAPDFNLTDKVIYLTRDPRDVAVSAFYRYRNLRKQKSKKPLKARIFDILTRFRFINLLLTHRRWTKHVDGWKHIDSYPVTYETLSSEPEKVLTGILNYLEIDVDRELIREAIEKFSFETVTGRGRGEENAANSEFRKGIVGNTGITSRALS